MSRTVRTSASLIKDLSRSGRLEIQKEGPRKKVKLPSNGTYAKKSGKRDTEQEEMKEGIPFEEAQHVDAMVLQVCHKCRCRFERNVLIGGLCKHCWLLVNVEPHPQDRCSLHR